MKKIILLWLITLLALGEGHAQALDLSQYEVYLGDTLISQSDFAKLKTLTGDRAKKLKFLPLTDGIKTSYYLSGKVYSTGEMKNLKENGIWRYWYENGIKAREGVFINGKPNGTHSYWYESGKPRGTGNWKNGVFDGEWVIYNENEEGKIVQTYKNGKLIN